MSVDVTAASKQAARTTRLSAKPSHCQSRSCARRLYTGCSSSSPVCLLAGTAGATTASSSAGAHAIGNATAGCLLLLLSDAGSRRRCIVKAAACTICGLWYNRIKRMEGTGASSSSVTSAGAEVKGVRRGQAEEWRVTVCVFPSFVMGAVERAGERMENVRHTSSSSSCSSCTTM